MTRFGLIDVGYGDEAHIEALSCLLKLSGERTFLSFCRAEVILRSQYPKVGFGDAHNEVLLRRCNGGLGLLTSLATCLPVEPRGEIKKRLR